MKSFLLSFLFLTVLSGSLSASAPVVVYSGDQSTSICSAQDYYLLDNLLIKDLDNDVVTILSVTSTNNSILNAATIQANMQFYYPAIDTTQVYVYLTVGNVATATNVTVTYNFTDGANTLTYQVTYTVKPSPAVTFLSTNYEICHNQGAIDLNEWVYPQGGVFQYDGEGVVEGGILESGNTNQFFSLDYTYTAANGCSVQVYEDVIMHEPPMLSISTTNSSSCTAGDGEIDATITTENSGNYVFVWNDGNTTDEYRTNLLPGNYHIDVTDEYGCIAEATTAVGLNGVTFNSVLDTVTCSGDTDGGINLNVTGLVGGLTYIWSSGQTSQNITGIGSGNYTVYVTDATGCMLSETIYMPQPDIIYNYSYAYGPTDCSVADGNVYVSSTYGGNGGYSYEWFDGTTGTYIGGLPAGIFTLTTTDYKGCTGVETYTLNDYGAPTVYLSNLMNSSCGGNTGAIDLDTSDVNQFVVFDWSNGSPDLDQQNLAPGVYTFHISNVSGCDYYEQFPIESIAPALQPICMITVDSATTTNLVVWDKVEPQTVAYYNIYRETINPDEFLLIDTVQNSNLSLFNDVMASPIAQSWRYKISAVDACGNEGVLSAAHKTMHITTLDLGNGDFKAVWNPYYGLEYDTYILYRFTASTGWVQIATLPSLINWYNDTPPNTVNLDYMVELDLNNFSCTADYEKAQDFNTTRSNKDKGAFSVGNGTGDSNNDLVEESISMNVYPNPTTDVLTIEISANGVNREAYLVTVDGQEVLRTTLNSVTETIDVSSLSNGFYFLKIDGNSQAIPVVKQ